MLTTDAFAKLLNFPHAVADRADGDRDDARGGSCLGGVWSWPFGMSDLRVLVSGSRPCERARLAASGSMKGSDVHPRAPAARALSAAWGGADYGAVSDALSEHDDGS